MNEVKVDLYFSVSFFIENDSYIADFLTLSNADSRAIANLYDTEWGEW